MSEAKKKIHTLQFGDIEVGKEHIFCFDGSIIGFDTLNEFVLISDEDTVPFKWLISLEQPEIGFPLLSPWHLDLTYEPGREFNFDEEVAMAVITLENENGMMTANLKAPIILNVKDQKGRQVILPNDKYSPTHVISK